MKIEDEMQRNEAVRQQDNRHGIHFTEAKNTGPERITICFRIDIREVIDYDSK